MIATTDAENQTTTTSYNALGNRLSVTDAENNTTAFSYDSLNRVVQTTNPLSGTNSVTYNVLGNRLTGTDANGHTSSFIYDNLNRVTQTTNANNQTTTTVYDGLGNRLSVTNHAGETTTFVYDEVNRLIQIVNPKSEIVNHQYDGGGNRVAMIDAEGVETRYEYDTLNRLTAVIENYVDGTFEADTPDEDVRTEYGYDKVGNRLNVTDANNHITSYVYDDLNRRIEMRDPLTNLTQYGYDAVGNRTSLTDANNETTTFIYDDVNRLTTIDYSDATPDVSFTYNQAGQRTQMSDGTGTTTYSYDDLYRLTGVNDGAGMQVGYGYDAVGNRTRLSYPNGYTTTYSYDDGNRLQTVTDWNNGQFGYNYDDANRLTGLNLPNGVSSGYTYDEAGRLLLLTHDTITETLASYGYDLDKVGNRRTLTETLTALLNIPAGAYLESAGQVVIEAENGQVISDTTHAWLTMTRVSGYTGTAYLHALPDVDALYQSTGPKAEYAVNFTTPGTYTVWVRGFATNAAGDSVYVEIGDERVSVTGFAPRVWQWANTAMPDGEAARLRVQSPGVYTISLQMREDGLRVDRLLLTTDTAYVPTDIGLAETTRQIDAAGLLTVVDRTINYDYDNLYRLTGANYSTGQSYAYQYDPVGNRLQQIINGDTTDYLYDAANRLEQLNGQPVYNFDANGNLVSSDLLTNTWDTANRLIASERDGVTVQPVYNGVNDRVGQTVGVSTTHFALDVQGLPEVIYTSNGEAYLHLPGVIMTESAAGEVRYLLSDGLGSVRQATDENAEVVTYLEFDPYGSPVNNIGGEPYGYTGEWYEGYTHLLHLRVRWYSHESGTFLSVDPVESEPPYQYVRGRVVNLTDPSGNSPGDDYPPSECRTAPTKFMYRDCILKHYGLEPLEEFAIFDDAEEELIRGTPGCNLEGPVLYRGPGYVEGDGVPRLHLRWGTEYVFDFATMQSAKFTYDAGWPFSAGLGGLSDGAAGFGYMKYIGTIEGFRSPGAGDIESDYSEDFYTFSVGLDGGIVSGGFLDAWTPDGKLTSRSYYVAFSLSGDPLPIADVDVSHVYYTMEGSAVNYAHNGKVDKLGKLLSDIDAGNDIFSAPHPSMPGYNAVYDLPLIGPGPNRNEAKQAAIRMAKIYEEIHSAYE